MNRPLNKQTNVQTNHRIFLTFSYEVDSELRLLNITREIQSTTLTDGEILDNYRRSHVTSKPQKLKDFLMLVNSLSLSVTFYLFLSHNLYNRCHWPYKKMLLQLFSFTGMQPTKIQTNTSTTSQWTQLFWPTILWLELCLVHWTLPMIWMKTMEDQKSTKISLKVAVIYCCVCVSLFISLSHHLFLFWGFGKIASENHSDTPRPVHFHIGLKAVAGLILRSVD